MNLYKIRGLNSSNNQEEAFILAVDRATAVVKFTQLYPTYCASITVEFICERDAMIPTAEPKSESDE